MRSNHAIIQTMKLSDIGEFGLIQKLKDIAEKTNPPSALVLGIGDDAAAWKNEPGLTLATTDCLIEGIHFTLKTASWYDIGWKSMAVNLSDIAAAGGSARYALVTLGLPENTAVEDVLLLYKGMVDLGQMYGVSIAGGNISRAPCVFIDISLTGISSGNILKRSTAIPGNKIAVSGYLGAAAAGWKLLLQAPDSNRHSSLVKTFLRPEPRLKTGELLASGGITTAIDISDGLIADLGHICRQSRCNAVINTDNLPLHPEAIEYFGEKLAMEMALSGGEDYELLFCGDETLVNNIKAVSSVGISIIGEISSYGNGEINLANEKGDIPKLNKSGWQHFA